MNSLLQLFHKAQMKEMKKILQTRIEKILQFGSLTQNQDNQLKYELMIQQKKEEKYRSIREGQILCSLSKIALTQSPLIEELFNISVSVCAHYDKEYEKYYKKFSVSMQENFRKLYSDFFNTHGFANKSKQVNEVFQRSLSFLSPSMPLGWLSQWSKKLYCEMLQKQINNSFQIREKSPKLSNCNSKNKNVKKEEDLFSINQSYISPIHHSPNHSQLAPLSLTLNSKSSIYGLFLQDLLNYYKMLNLDEIDFNYLKTIRKRNNKQHLLKPLHLSKATEIIIETSGNREISKIIKTYQNQYFEKFPVPPSKSSILCKNQAPTSPKKKIRNSTENREDFVKVKSKLLSPKLSEIEMLRPEQLEEKIKKLRMINSKTSKNNLEFPNIRQNKRHLEKRMNFSQNPSIVLPKNCLKTNLMDSLEKRLKERQFLRCESIQSRFKFPNDYENCEDGIYGSRVDSSLKLKKVNSDFIECEYDDTNMKYGKNFDIHNLRANHKIPKIKPIMVAKFFNCP